MDASVRQPAEEPVNDHPLAGLTAGLVLRATRHSAGLTQSTLADALHITEDTVRAWENGIEPLASIPLHQVDLLKDTLLTAGADPDLAADIDPATWCDVIVMAMHHGEDTSCLLADPLAAEPSFAELFDWATTGQIPARYRPYTQA